MVMTKAFLHGRIEAIWMVQLQSADSVKVEFDCTFRTSWFEFLC